MINATGMSDDWRRTIDRPTCLQDIVRYDLQHLSTWNEEFNLLTILFFPSMIYLERIPKAFYIRTAEV